VSITEFFDCDGRLGGLDALVLTTTQFGCYNCESEARDLPGHISSWESEGLDIVHLSLLLDGPGDGPSTIEGAGVWRDNFGLYSSYVATDSWYSMVPGSGSFATPMRTTVNPRTMEVLDIEFGYASYSTVLDYARDISTSGF